MKKFFVRSITGIAFVAVIVFGTIFSSLAYIPLFMIVTGLMMYEFYRLVTVRQNRPNIPMGILIGLSVFSISILYAIGIAPPELISAIIPLILLVFVHELYRYKKNPLANVSLTFLGVIYVAVPMSLLNFVIFRNVALPDEVQVAETSIDFINNIMNYFLFLKPEREILYSPELLLSFFAIIWIYDSMAYVFGVTIGRHSLFKSVSPKKSWEGFFGGLVFTPITAYALYRIVGFMEYPDWLIFAFLVVISSTFGDLVESLFKRHVGIKDSGSILPGHGGLLDRFDSVLFAAPMAYLYLELYY